MTTVTTDALTEDDRYELELVAVSLIMDHTPPAEREANLARLVLAGYSCWLCEQCWRESGSSPDVLRFNPGRESCLKHGERVEVGFHEALQLLMGRYMLASPRMMATSDALHGRRLEFSANGFIAPPTPVEGESTQSYLDRYHAWQDARTASVQSTIIRKGIEE